MNDKELLEVTKRVLDGCGTLSLRDRLLVLQLAWAAIAQRARYEALLHPGGFRDERVRQVGQLEKMVDLLKGDVPSLEMERFVQETDIDGLLEHVRKQCGDIDR
jgi:hypothetical protein